MMPASFIPGEQRGARLRALRFLGEELSGFMAWGVLHPKPRLQGEGIPFTRGWQGSVDAREKAS